MWQWCTLNNDASYTLCGSIRTMPRGRGEGGGPTAARPYMGLGFTAVRCRGSCWVEKRNHPASGTRLCVRHTRLVLIPNPELRRRKLQCMDLVIQSANHVSQSRQGLAWIALFQNDGSLTAACLPSDLLHAQLCQDRSCIGSGLESTGLYRGFRL